MLEGENRPKIESQVVMESQAVQNELMEGQ